MEHCYFVVKEQLAARIGPALQKALSSRGRGGAGGLGIAVGEKGNLEVLPLRDILLFERIGRKTRVCTVKGERVTMRTPEELLRGLPEGVFIQCHRSFWVNLGGVKALRGDEFVLSDDRAIPISRTFRRQARESFFASLVRHGE